MQQDIPPDAIKGRGSAWAIAHRFESRERETYDDGWGTLDQQAQELVQAVSVFRLAA